MSTHESPQQLTTEDTITPTHYEEMEDNSNTEISDDNIKKLKRKLKEIQEVMTMIHYIHFFYLNKIYVAKCCYS